MEGRRQRLEIFFREANRVLRFVGGLPQVLTDASPKEFLPGGLRATKTAPQVSGLNSAEAEELLLQAKMNTEAKDANGYDAIMIASYANKADAISRWLKRFPDWDLGRRDVGAGVQALGIAIFFSPDSSPVLRVLLDGRASIDQKAHNGFVVLQCHGRIQFCCQSLLV